VASFFIKGVFKGSITSRASSIAFSFFLAMFPMIIAFFTLIPFIPIDNFQFTLLSLIQSITPDSTETIINQTLVDIINRPRGGLLSITFVLTLFFATNGFSSIIEAFNNTYHSIETRSWVKQKLISLVLFFIISTLIIVAITMLITGTFAIKFLYTQKLLPEVFSPYLLEGGRWLLLTAMFFFTISFIYYLAPAKASKFRFISAGSTLATFLALGASIGFNFYVQNFSSYNALYGSIGTLLIVLVWIYFNSIILLIGFELNASIYSAGKENHRSLHSGNGVNIVNRQI
jgi:membrane protein